MTASVIEHLKARRNHLERFATSKGAAGEVSVLSARKNWIPRPKGKRSKNLSEALEKSGIKIKPTAFDMISFPDGQSVNLDSVEDICKMLPQLTFIEVKTATQARVKPGFDNFFFAFTENEISAAEQLGPRYMVALYNSRTEELLLASLPEVMSRAGSTTWQVSIQLRPAKT